MKLLVCLATLCSLAMTGHAAAQTAPGAPVGTPPGTEPGGEGPSLAVPQFGAWLDDATIEGRGVGRVTAGVGYWRTVGGTQTDAPMIDAGYGVSDRIYISAFVPFYRATIGGQSMRGLDDLYLSAKFVVKNAATEGGRFGLAVSPAMEILSGAFTSGDRVHWALPVSAEVRARPVRIYMTGGYFSRGALFGGAALEWTAPTASVVWVSLTDSFALETGTDLPLPAGDRHRVDIAVGVAHPLNSRLAAYVSVGRTLSDVSAGGASLGAGGGISVRLSRSTSAH